MTNSNTIKEQALPINSRIFVKVKDKHWNATLLKYDKNDSSKVWVHYDGQKKKRTSKVNIEQVQKTIPRHNDVVPATKSFTPYPSKRKAIRKMQAKIKRCMKPLKKHGVKTAQLEEIIDAMKKISGNEICHAFFGQTDDDGGNDFVMNDTLKKIYADAKEQLAEFQKSGAPPKIDWDDVEKKWEKYLNDFLGSDDLDVKVVRKRCPTVKYNVDSLPTSDAKYSPLKEPKHIDLDKYMNEKGGEYWLPDKNPLCVHSTNHFC